MGLLGNLFQENSPEVWLTTLIVAGAISFLALIIKRIILSRIKKDEAVPATYSHLFIRLVNRTHFIFLSAVGVSVGALQLSLPEILSDGIRTAFLVILFLQVGLWGIAVINFYVSRYIQQRSDDDAGAATTIAALGMLGKGVLWVLIFLLTLENLGVEVTTLIAGLGISGIAVALAVQSILGDLFASFTIVMDQPIVIGDTINIDEHIGMVEYIGLKSTRIRSINGEQLIFSNADLLNSRICNFKRMERRRTLLMIGVTYQTPHEKLARIPDLI